MVCLQRKILRELRVLRIQHVTRWTEWPRPNRSMNIIIIIRDVNEHEFQLSIILKTTIILCTYSSAFRSSIHIHQNKSVPRPQFNQAIYPFVPHEQRQHRFHHQTCYDMRKPRKSSGYHTIHQTLTSCL
jgi:hypothetical protein